MDETQVLYGDYNGHLRPLNLMYFSLDSRCLVADHPESVAEEVESHFCPMCNGLFTTPDAISTENRCPRCYECPCCGSVLAPSRVSLEEALAPSSSRDAGRSFCLQCLYCQWTSEESGVVAPDPASLAEAAAAAAAREKESCGGGGSAAGIDALLKAARQREAVAASARGGGGGAARLRAGSGGGGGVAGTAGGTTSTSLFSTASGAGASATGPWKIAHLEEAVALRNKAVAAASSSPASPPPPAAAVGGGDIAQGAKDAPNMALSPRTPQGDTAGPDPALWTLASGHEAAGLSERLESSWSPPSSSLTSPLAGRGVGESGGGGGGGTARSGGGAGWSPRRVRLRTRLGKRCRKDLADGRTGILIKATYNPLEGDSSNAKKGVKKQWFKKDCSAALLVPRVTVAALPSSLTLLGPAAVSTEQVNPREQDDDAAALGSGATGAGEGTGAAAAAAQQRPPALVLRLANPQHDTLLRLRVARDDHAPASAAESGGGGGGDRDGDDGTTAGGAGVGGGGGGGAAVTATSVVTVRPEGWKEGDVLRLEGKEDEILRRPGERHRLPVGALARHDGATGNGDAAAAGHDNAPPFLVHQEGDVAWVRVSLDDASVVRVATAAAVTGASSALARPSLVVDVRFSLVMGEGEEEAGAAEAGGASGDVSMPISVRFPLSACPT